ncbi:MAG: pyruvate formate lyase 1-activating protein, partial [Candidatus Saccharibacteria bacterium]
DTSGFVEVAKVERLLTLTDLVMLSIKHPDPDRHLELTGHSPGRTQAFASYLTEIGKPTWIRYVIIPGVTDNLTDLGELSKMVSRMPNVARVELLPYNNLGLYKWSELGLGYRFSGIQPPTPEHMADLRKQMLDMLPRVPVL